MFTKEELFNRIYGRGKWERTAYSLHLERVEQALKSLPDLQRQILKHQFGLDGTTPAQSLEDLEWEIGLNAHGIDFFTRKAITSLKVSLQ